jgi:FixJ family two-component response regulator
MTDATATVVVVDDDFSVRESLESLLRSVGYEVRLFASVIDYLASPPVSGAFCLVLDIRLPGQSGLDLQSELARTGEHPQIIFITGHGDIPMTVRAMKAGAVEFLAKPFRDQDLLDAIQEALRRDRERIAGETIERGLKARFDSLSSREREIMAQVTTGLLNKQIAAAVGLSEITVKVHRGHLMRKMGAKSLAALVRMADRLGLSRGQG